MMTNPGAQEHSDNAETVPKQVVDVVDLAHSVKTPGKVFRHQLELNTIGTSESRWVSPTCASPTQVFSNIEIDGVTNRTLVLKSM